MTSLYHPSVNLGILGGGQLGRMLIPSSLNLGIHLHFLDKVNTPCQDASPYFKVGDIQDESHIIEFSKGLDLLTIEIENVNTQALKTLEEKRFPVCPSSKVISIVQDKLIQKQFYEKSHFPTASFIPVHSLEEIKNYLSKHKVAIQKLRRNGYDGQGVKLLEENSDLSKAFTAPSFLEEKVNFTKEIAVMLARNRKGEISFFPTVEMFFHPKNHILEYLISPASIEEKIKKEAYAIASALAEKLAMVGVLAIEFFLTNKGDLLINEISPRPHNSAHYTMDIGNVSQFEQHLRSILDLPLKQFTMPPKSKIATFNLLAAATKETLADSKTLSYKNFLGILEYPFFFLHLYGKKKLSPFRKIGHVNILGESQKDLDEKLSLLKNELQKYSKDTLVTCLDDDLS